MEIRSAVCSRIVLIPTNLTTQTHPIDGYLLYDAVHGQVSFESGVSS